MIQYRRTMLVSTVRAIVKSVTGITLVTNYGDPDFAREFGLARKAFRFCEDLVMTRKNAFAIICVDEVISKYVSANFPGQRLHFLPNGACEEGFEPPTTESTIVKSLGRSLVWKGNVFLYASQVTSVYRLHLLVSSAPSVIRQCLTSDTSLLVAGQHVATEKKRQSNKTG